MESTTVTVIAGGELLAPPPQPQQSFVIAADSGYDHALEHGISVDLLVGDMDSITSSGLAEAQRRGVRMVRHNTDKDQTDLELALEEASKRGAKVVDIHGGEGGTIDHLLGVALGLASDRWSHLALRWHTATGRVSVVRPGQPVTVPHGGGTRFSIIPASNLSGVRVVGSQWPLDDETLEMGSTRGLSNEVVNDTATVSIATGAGLVISEGE